MADIYRTSQRTLVWIGEAGAVEAAIKVLGDIDDLGITGDTPLSSVLPGVAEIVKAYFTSKYSPTIMQPG